MLPKSPGCKALGKLYEREAVLPLYQTQADQTDRLHHPESRDKVMRESPTLD